MITAPDPPDDWEDDGWGELGVDSKLRMTSQELERTKKAHAILRLSTLLHKRIVKDVSTFPNLDSLPPLSSLLVVASDDLVSTLYTPQTPSETSKELAAFVTVIDSLRSALLEPSLADQMQAMSLQPTQQQKDPIKWFQACFVQIQKAADNLSSTL
ncbi:hypothetical protein C0993_012010 [Termitomyces sp. T159_Od127]|nr:hypothetical protein C0993_012010 [Termitomyces sp. T159_Od127]